MAFKTGFCSSGVHDQCLVVAVNGHRAHDRYVLCTCLCHDNSPGSVALLLDRAPSDLPQPVVATLAECARYVDTLNAVLRPAVGNVGDDDDGYSA